MSLWHDKAVAVSIFKTGKLEHKLEIPEGWLWGVSNQETLHGGKGGDMNNFWSNPNSNFLKVFFLPLKPSSLIVTLLFYMLLF